jgi:acyl-coenzyme A synthetase/AMP-(fatty) acid ligase/acyl carrier protein
LNLVFWHRRAFDVTPADRATQLASPGFDAAVWELWPYLTAGARLHIPDEVTRVTPEMLRDWLVSEKISISFLPTMLAERVLALEWPRETALRVLLTGADTLHHYPSNTLPFRLINNYGPTECTVVATSGPVLPGSDTSHPPTIGRAIDNTQTYILDEQLRNVPIGTPGELYIGGASVGPGYLNRPELTAERFVSDPFSGMPGDRLYKTGDLARLLPDGQIAFLGRIDDQIKIRGYRIEPNEIVTALNRHPMVRESIVVASEDGSGDKRLVAYLVLPEGSEVAYATLQSFLLNQLPDFMVPSVFVHLGSLPLSPNGKVDRSALPAPDAANTLKDENRAAPRTPVEERLASMVAGLLGLQEVALNDNFFMLGGHSLLGTQLLARVRAAFGVEIRLRSLFDQPTVAGLSAEVERLLVANSEAANRSASQCFVAPAIAGANQ